MRDRRKKWGPKIDGMGIKAEGELYEEQWGGRLCGKRKMTLRRRYVDKESLE